ncbi:MAG: TIGR02147 family protein [Fibrobacter sp.]|nr:TIGR02147 family protein [Fibrobacter sp.]
MNIYDYIDYRKYLNDALAERKAQNRHFTFRFIAQHLNLSSPGFFNWVISGKRKLPEALIPKLAILFKLDDKECAYLHLLVRYNHSTDLSERKELFEKLSCIIKKQNKHELRPEQYQLFSKWYYLAIRELLSIMPFKDDFRLLATSLFPRIKTKEAREAIGVLEKIGVISRDEQGFYRPVETLLTTGEVWESELITNLQIQMIELGKKSLISVPKKERDISNITIKLSETAMKQLSAEIAALRQKILTLSENDHTSDRVYQCNLQLFPVTMKQKVSNEYHM